MGVIRHLGERRRERQKQLEDLDVAIEAALEEVHASRGAFDAELSAARALALAGEAEPVPTEPLVALRAGLAAKSARTRATRRRHVYQAVPGAVAAVMAGLVAFAGFSSSGGTAPTQQLLGISTAAKTLQKINQNMALVQDQVDSGNRLGAQQRAEAARDAMLEAQREAAALPASNPLRDVLLTAAQTEIRHLQELLAKLQLQIAQLPPPPVSTSIPLTKTSTPSSSDNYQPTTESGGGSSGSSSTSTSQTSQPSSASSGSGASVPVHSTGPASSTVTPSSSTTSSSTSTSTSSTTSSSTTSTSTTSTTEPSSTTTTTQPKPLGSPKSGFYSPAQTPIL